MFISYCDVCKDQCGSQTTRRFENLNGDLGLEVVILHGDKPVGDTHLCDKCLFKMFWTMMEHSPVIDLKQEFMALLNNQKARSPLPTRVQDRQTILDNSTRSDPIAQQKELIRQAEARGRQRAIDEKEYPEYTQSVDLREHKRRGGI